TTLFILAIMSIATWYIFITKFLTQSSLLGQARRARTRFWEERNFQDGLRELGPKSVFRKVAEDGLRGNEHHNAYLADKVGQYEWVAEVLRRSVDSVSGRLQGGSAVLATVGSVAPFVGLFGTVWGILHALITIGVSGGSAAS